MQYRQDLQILRGLAVLFVVLYHFGIPMIGSGFLGVDVFFVISGFLMSKLYDPKDKRHFFRRRALRLLPAYFSIVLLTAIASIFLVTPNEFNQVSIQSLFDTFFTSNFGFWAQNSYFASSEFNPLLHLWSLGVEVQFYLIVPLLFYLFKLNKVFFILIFSTSLLLCLFMIGISPKTSFFMMPLRLWEFLIGFGIARYMMPNGGGVIKGNKWLATMGMIMILTTPFFSIDGDSFSVINGHPGIGAIVITLSTGLVLLYGIGIFNYFRSVGNVLEIVGKYSYSIYLVHFPVIVLFMYQPFSGTQLQIGGMYSVILLLAMTIFLSYFLYQLIEVKLRKSRSIKKILIAFPFLIILAVWSGESIQKNVFSERQFKISSAYADRGVYRCGRFFQALNPSEKSCRIGKKIEGTERILLVGNSHADSIKESFVEVANKNNVEVYFVAEGTPLMRKDQATFISKLLNKQMNVGDIVDEAVNKKMNHIVVHYSYGAISINIINSLVEQAYKKSIKVSYMMPIPVHNERVPKMLWNNNAPLVVESKSNYKQNTKDYFQKLKQIRQNNFETYATVNYFCKGQCKIISEDGSPYYFDDSHLTLTGAKVLAPLFEKIIKKDNEI
jgi:peptidoglycan/LPS O-acetylase OafA/YrhL